MDGDGIEFAVINDWTSGSILLPYKKEGGCGWTVGRCLLNPSGGYCGVSPGLPISSFILIPPIGSCRRGQGFGRVKSNLEVISRV
jgi:hypothetical protein